MAVIDLLKRLQREAGTDGTHPVLPAVPVTGSPVLTCTAGTHETAQNEGTAPSLVACWRFHFADRDLLYVSFCPAVSHADALASYPNAVAAEPIHERPRRAATESESRELQGLIEAVYFDETDSDLAAALAHALTDPAGALRCYRAILKARGL